VKSGHQESIKLLIPANINRLKFTLMHHMHWKIIIGEKFLKDSIENFDQVDGIQANAFDL
jgi:hypothetical protein